MLNSVSIQGRLGRDPELKQTANGKNVCTIPICCERNVDKYAENKPNAADWFDVVLWDSQAQALCRHCRKGSEICVEGRLEAYKYVDIKHEDRYGIRIKAHRFYFCGPRQGQGSKPSKADADVEFEDLGEDDGQLPF